MKFEEFEDEEERRLKELLDEMVEKLSDPKSKQSSFQRDYSKRRFEKFDQTSQEFVDLNFLAIHCN